MALLKRLSTDRSLEAFRGQFVPLKLTTDGNPEWSQWARRYRAEGDGIPRLYVVRADGEMLYGKAGSLPGQALPTMLLTTLKQSGRTFSDAETVLLQKSLEEAKAALAEENQIGAARALSKLKPLGTVGNLKSYSVLAQEADKLAEQVAQQGGQDIEAAQAKLSDSATAFEGIVTLVAAEDAYAAFPELNAKVVSALREAKRNEALDGPVKQAEAVARARKLAASEKVATRKSAVAAYELVLERFPGTPGAEIARKELTALAPDSPALSAEAPADEYRSWTDASGKFSIEAKFVQQKQGFVQLQKRDGSLIAVEIKQLSPEDQTFLQRQ